MEKFNVPKIETGGVPEKSESKEKIKIPEGWRTRKSLAQELGIDSYTIERFIEKKEYKKTNPEFFSEFPKNNTGVAYTHYSPELVEILEDNFGNLDIDKDEKKSEAELYTEKGWRTNLSLEKELKTNRLNILRICEKYKESNPEYFKKIKNKRSGSKEYYTPELVEIIKEKISKLQSTESPPNGWETGQSIATRLVAQNSKIKTIVRSYRDSNPEYFNFYKNHIGQIVEHFSPALVSIIEAEIDNFNNVQDAPEGWISKHNLAKKLGVHHRTIEETIDGIGNDVSEEYVKYYKGENKTVVKHYSPDFANIIEVAIAKNKEAQAIPIGWKANYTLSRELKIAEDTTKRVAYKYKEENPDFFKNYNRLGKLIEHYSPDLVEIIKQEVLSGRENKNQKEEGKILRTKFENFIQDITDPEADNEQAKKIGEILQLLPGNAHDILLKYHPEYKGMSVGYVKKIIAEYLGDFMLVKKEWRADDVEKFKEVADIENIHEAILFNLKGACLSYINREKKNNPEVDERMLVESYFNQPEMQKVVASGILEFEKVAQELKEYFEGILEMKDKKPGNVVEFLKEGRVFPDINQLMNIKEMQKNQKLLIADEMGLGKSASAILTKEYLGLKCAVVVVPSNVVDTWGNYLSDKVAENGKQVGYFKNGLTPKVLAINSPEDMGRLKTEVFDYVLISQERIAGKGYAEALDKIDFDMMIVDEVHKLKNIDSGVRSEAVMGLAEKIYGKDKYLALLSGTPAPNKVKDVAVILKMLYPEKYKKFDNKEMVNRILYSDLIDLRTELLMRTQMKELVSSIEMPPLTEKDIEIELSPEEREIYEILLEEDELTASEKIITFRQFLLNPELLKVEPGFSGSKVEALEKTLNEELKIHDKVVVFVNGYVEGVIRGERNIIEKMNLPEGVVVEEIHGEIGHDERKRIEDELKTKDQKTIVFVSGQTADVGVDFSGADHVISYNEPWSKYDKKQQVARVYREGLKHPLTATTLVVRNSIEEGIRRYINSKEKAIEKLLRGINNTDAEKKLLYNDSQLTKENVETNAELSKEYLSDWEKLMVHFGEGFEAGEKEFKRDLKRKGKEYADLYRKLGRLTYQGNNARVTATILENMIGERNEKVDDLRILDIASGPEMLKEASTEKLKNKIFSLDINKEHFTPAETKTKRIVASYLNLPAKDSSVDYCNLGFAFHQTSPIKYYKKNYERLQVLAEMNRVLKPGGRAVISMLHNIKIENEEKFGELLESVGLKLVSNYSGEAVGGVNYKAHLYTFEKVENIPEYKNEEEKYVKLESPRDINKLAERVGDELLEGLEMEKLPQGKSRLKDQRRMIDKITIGGKEIKVIFNERDGELFENEIQSIKDGEALKEKFGGIANIPIDEIKKIGFERKLETRGYYLLYKIIKDGGAVIVRGDYKQR